MQYSILCVSAKYLKNGGRLVYSTCSLNPNENTWVVEKFLHENNDFHCVDLFDDHYGFKKSGTLTLLPHSHDTDGFFIAVLEKNN
ncbi:Ribosomal RNA small subunit methyltransferase B [bioreactor metagenome]|uniref:Ribosomal RNA small subunit methyltransferase B n=1 Tax=bioreactor metagenome TaxID=1076179 RepID=A0A645C5G5_9ZZZZ